MTDTAAETSTSVKSMDDIMALCKRRGFIYPASEIYGGVNGFWDYGPLGAQLKKNLRDAWWTDVVMKGCNGELGPDGKPISIVPLDSSIIQNPKVWEASGHVGGFNDPMVDDKETKERFRADHLQGIYSLANPLKHSTDSETTEGGKLVYGESSTISLPNKTVVASNFDEAVQLLVDSKSLRKINGIKSIKLIEYVTGFMLGYKVEIDFGKGPEECIVGSIGFGLRHCPEKIPSPFTGKAGHLTPPREFNLMFKTVLGATGNAEDNGAYLRPETAQGIFINFKNVVDTTRVSVPFGIAQTGKAFRNEVTPRNFTFRSREFEQMEIEFFCHPDDSKGWYEFWRDWRMQWWQDLGLKGENLILREHDKDELAHYAKEGAGTADIEYMFPFTAPGYGELEGIADRTNFDLKQHAEHSKTKLDYFDNTRGELAKNGQPKGERYLPHVIEPSAGLDRGVLALLCEAFTPDENRPSGVYMKFHPRIAPIKAAVFPLVKKDGMPEIAEPLARELRNRFGHLGTIDYDVKQSIGKRYARMDEAGCPFCFTIDSQTLEDQSVTVRHRDTLEQERIALDKVGDFLAEKLEF
ncbi:MAG: glycine--tRNA ligase [Phycisphaerales bacterium]|nr:glycine--tRNA ligase [Phycisphaerales bacterium]